MFTGLVKGVKIDAATGEIYTSTIYSASDYIEVNVNSNSYFLKKI